MEFSLEHIVKEPKIKLKNPALLLMLHGYGSHEEDLFSFAHELPDELLVVSARAPLSLGYGGYAWYSIHYEKGVDKMSDVPEALQARELIRSFIKELKTVYQFDSEKSFLMGFSQGSILSYAISLSYPNMIKNILALSGYVQDSFIKEPENMSDYNQLDYFCSHGSVDEVIPVRLARKTKNFLLKKNIKHTYKEYPIGHGVSPENFTDIKQWIIKKLEL